MPGTQRLAISGGTGGDGWKSAHAPGKRTANALATGQSHRALAGEASSGRLGKRAATAATMAATVDDDTQLAEELQVERLGQEQGDAEDAPESGQRPGRSASRLAPEERERDERRKRHEPDERQRDAEDAAEARRPHLVAARPDVTKGRQRADIVDEQRRAHRHRHQKGQTENERRKTGGHNRGRVIAQKIRRAR